MVCTVAGMRAAYAPSHGTDKSVRAATVPPSIICHPAPSSERCRSPSPGQFTGRTWLQPLYWSFKRRRAGRPQRLFLFVERSCSHTGYPAAPSGRNPPFPNFIRNCRRFGCVPSRRTPVSRKTNGRRPAFACMPAAGTVLYLYSGSAATRLRMMKPKTSYGKHVVRPAAP